MRSLRPAVLAVTAALFSVSALAAEHRLQPGQYEMKTEMKMEGVEHAIPPTTRTHCYSADDVKDDKKLAQGGEERSKDCEMTDMKTAGSRMTWSMTCKSGTKGTGEMTYAGDGYDMTLNLETAGGPHGPMKMKVHTTARRTGDCAK